MMLTDMLGKELEVGQTVARAAAKNFIELRKIEKIEGGCVYLEGSRNKPVWYEQNLLIIAEAKKND